MTNPTIFLSFAAGVLSFLSPCVLPLIPSYLSYVGGVTLAELKSTDRPDGSVVVRTILFIIGFSIVFIVLGILFSGTGFLFSRLSSVINLVAGLVVILLALNMIFDFWKFLNMERRLHFKKRPAGYIGSVAIGMAFGAGWTPCIGPILAGILFLASKSGAVGLGVLYLSAYSLGLGVPFLLASLFFRQVTTQLNRLKKHFVTIRIVSGVLLAAIGLLVAFGRLQEVNNALVAFGVSINTWHEQSPGRATWVLGTISLSVGLLFLVPGVAARFRAAQTRVLSPIRAAFLTLFAGIAALEYAGVINIASVLYHWLTFQGL